MQLDQPADVKKLFFPVIRGRFRMKTPFFPHDAPFRLRRSVSLHIRKPFSIQYPDGYVTFFL